MPKANRICKTDGKAYYYCPGCPDDRRPNWYVAFCCERCREIFNVLTSSFLKKITTEEAQQKLIELHAETDITLTDDIRKHVAMIMETYNPGTKDEENISQEEELQVVVEEINVPVKMTYKPKKKNVKNSEVID